MDWILNAQQSDGVRRSSEIFAEFFMTLVVSDKTHIVSDGMTFCLFAANNIHDLSRKRAKDLLNLLISY
jgi:hypothetical protein